ncbi:hypothetical protein AVEN_40620-1 [Araneus ventricosus]|uniref:Uncharacterized protein n=1 Tax=Araneus ventricosus TaxID=182803 RepID=A0A4Y2JAU0_ARAVE|nr:hypothetical protein AVEN_40620-1 [Araneus ventricosus]
MPGVVRRVDLLVLVDRRCMESFESLSWTRICPGWGTVIPGQSGCQVVASLHSWSYWLHRDCLGAITGPKWLSRLLHSWSKRLSRLLWSLSWGGRCTRVLFLSLVGRGLLAPGVVPGFACSCTGFPLSPGRVHGVDPPPSGRSTRWFVIWSHDYAWCGSEWCGLSTLVTAGLWNI